MITTNKPPVEEVVAHFGVKGMRWGVHRNEVVRTDAPTRRSAQKHFRKEQLPMLKTRLYQTIQRKGLTKEEYSKLSTKDTIVKTGKTVKRVTRNPNAADGALFVSRTMKDAQIYRGVMPSSKFLGAYRKPSLEYSEVTFRVIKQLNSPSEKERVDSFVHLMDTRSIHMVDGRKVTGREWLQEQGYSHQVKKLDSFELGITFYQKFTKTNGLKDCPINSAYFKSLQKRGYNAIVDDNDRNIVSKEPWLVLDSKGALQNLRVKPLTGIDVFKAQQNLVFPKKTKAVKHFGIRGMHWGVRKSEGVAVSTEGFSTRRTSKKTVKPYISILNSPPHRAMTKEDYDALTGSGEKFAKGLVLRRISTTSATTLKGAAFVSRLNEDALYYKAIFPAYGPMSGKVGGGRKVYKRPSYEVELQTIKKLSAPSEKVRVDTYLKLLDEPSIMLEGRHAAVTGRQFLEMHGYEAKFKQYPSKEVGLQSWYKFVHTQGDQKNPLVQAYFESLKSKGYNALSDDSDRGVLTKAPLILLDPEKTVKVIRVKRLSADEINRAQRQLKRH